MKYVKLKDKSKEWGLTDRGLRNLCEKGKIEGAKKENNTWLIPELALKPLKLKKGELLKIFRQEKKMKLHGGLYHKTQIDLAYNSNHIEGSRLSHDQTRYIFETKSVLPNNQDAIRVDDIIETQNHFYCFDYIIDSANRTLTEEYIKKLHYLLKSRTTDSDLEWFNVGEYKKYANEIGEKTTTLPKNVKYEMQKLLSEYNSKKEITFLDIVDFHYKFESIHPFQDGNGRVGRLIMFKECLKYDIIPFIITDENKALYYNGLKNYEHEKGYLTGTCKLMQDDFTDIIRYFLEK